jgi:hypothetical protein
MAIYIFSTNRPACGDDCLQRAVAVSRAVYRQRTTDGVIVGALLAEGSVTSVSVSTQGQVNGTGQSYELGAS